jgi:type I restriction enzyme S subunit
MGNVPREWEVVQLGQLYSERKEKGLARLPVMSVTLDRGLVPRRSLERRVESELKPSEHALAREGDLVYNMMRMWQGASGVASVDCMVSPAYVVARPSERLLPAFAGYLLRAPRIIRLLYSYSQGITRDRLRLYFENFAEVPIPLPPVPEQRKIVAILSSLDDAIEETQKVIEQAKRVKQGLLQTLMTRGIGGHTQFKTTEIGKIPSSWAVKRLLDLTEKGFRNGYSPNSPNTPTGQWILSLGALSPDGLRVDERKPAPVDDAKVRDFLLEPGDFLISRANTRERVGWSAVFRGQPGLYAFPDLMMQFRVKKEEILPEYLEAYLYSRSALRHVQGRAAGTSGSMVKIKQAVVRELPIALPPYCEQEQIAEAVNRVRVRLEVGQAAGAALSRTKRGLLQDLLTGRVRVPAD